MPKGAIPNYAARATEIVGKAWRFGMAPEPVLTVSEWSDQNRILSQKAASEPGLWRTDRTPYLKEIMDCLSASAPETRIVLMKGAQIGATECGNNWIGYVMDQAPGPMLSVLPTVDMAKRASKQRIAPMIEETPALSGKVKEARARDSGNTVLAKEFPGGVLVMTGANSAVGLRSMPARYIFLDEVDGYPGDVDGEGDPVALAEARARTFRRRKIFMASTPTIAGESRVEREFEKSDKRYYFVPCPECEHFQRLRFEQLQWDKGNPRSARYVCEECGSLLGDEHKTEMLRRGEWRATAEGNGTVGYHLSSLYSPVGWLSWVEIAQRWEAAQGDNHLLKEFINTVLGETWKERGDAPDHARLLERKGGYEQGTIPPGGLMLVGGADVQHSGIWYEIVALARDARSWTVEHGFLEGDTTDPNGGAFASLAEVHARKWPDAHGRTRGLDALAVDAGDGGRANQVLAWCRTRAGTHAIKGVPGWHAPAIGTPTPVEVTLNGRKVAVGVKLWPVGTWSLKTTWYAHLRKVVGDDGAPPGYCYFHAGCDERYFRQLTSEYLAAETVRGRTVRVWKELGPNHLLDCRIYAMAMAELLGLSRMTPDEWALLERERGIPAEVAVAPVKAPADATQGAAPSTAAKEARRNNWIRPQRSNWLRRG